jgi:hypothetical protein
LIVKIKKKNALVGKENWKLKNYNNLIDSWKYGSILAIQKTLVKIWLQFFKDDFHIHIYYFMLHHIWVIIWNRNENQYSIFNFLPWTSQLIHIFWRAPKFLVDPLEGPSMRQCGSNWNLEPLPSSQHLEG